MTSVSIVVGRSDAPVPVIDAPAVGTHAAVGAPVSFSGHAVDGAGHQLPASALSWRVDLLHCPSACHRHPGVYSAEGVTSGTFNVPDHDFPAALQLRLTATANGRTTTVTRRVDYQSTSMTFTARPVGISLTIGSTKSRTPITRSLSTNGIATVSAPADAVVFFNRYRFVSWSDGGARTHDITVPTAPATLTANYVLVGPILGGGPFPATSSHPLPRP